MNRGVRIAAWLLAGLAVLTAVILWRAGLVGAPHIVGFYFPIFSRDGASVFAVQRDTRAIVTGFGYEMFTPPATVRYLRDRYVLVQVNVSSGAVTAIERLPPSPLEGTTVHGYRNALFGIPSVHLRWRDADHLEYEIAITTYDVPASRTFVVRTGSAQWVEAPTRMSGGFEPQQLRGDQEVIQVPGPEAVPCAIVLRQGQAAGRALMETNGCRARYPAGYTAEVLTPLSRRAEIERAELVRTTYDNLVQRGLRSGLSDGDARLAAGREMERLGLFPRTPKLIAAATACPRATPLFSISDDEFRFGLFPDIEQAIAEPGKEVERHGDYLTHRDYTTSKEINDLLASGATEFFVKAHAQCWRMTIDK